MSVAHQPVLRTEVARFLAPRDGAVLVDGTFGGGGYSVALLEAADCRIFAIDRDPEAIAVGAPIEAHYRGRLQLLEGRFSEMRQLLANAGVARADGVALDLGVSSRQLDAPERGFSFREDGPLDMRMERRGRTAADVVNETGQGELADIIWRYGEERRSRAIARAIVERRQSAPFRRTKELADLVASLLRGGGKVHPATRTFQALRIFVNDELGELRRGLSAAEQLLAAGGRLAVVSFHSLEDREVKRCLADRSGKRPGVSRHRPAAPAPAHAPSFRLLSRGAVRPNEAEVSANPRARSARLRAAERTSAEPWPEEMAA